MPHGVPHHGHARVRYRWRHVQEPLHPEDEVMSPGEEHARSACRGLRSAFAQTPSTWLREGPTIYRTQRTDFILF
ncbi:hypothetical protein L798_01497 [Zootermopsis nevadensis]|uniref:Uncharacterized protein n=1 Tax=Zootermopsis nevadensis TaxID=136037 RepID=A0A067RPI1_ZOONE|nr:hypothetical protein L798_01497 [Zootermopsis nevadensis]